MLHLKKLHQYSCWHRLLFEKEFPTGCARSGWWTGDEVSGKIRNDNILQSYASPPTLPLSNLKHKSPDFEFLICCPLSVCLLDHVVEVPKIKNSNVSKDSISVLYFTLFSAQILGFQPFLCQGQLQVWVTSSDHYQLQHLDLLVDCFYNKILLPHRHHRETPNQIRKQTAVGDISNILAS